MNPTVRVLQIFALLLSAGVAQAQSFSAFDIDTSQFPLLKAKFYAFDAAGKQQKPQQSEVAVSESGVNRSVISITCPPDPQSLTLSTVLVMDASGSMSGGNLNIAKAAANFWVNNALLSGGECALSSFDHSNYYNQDFTNDKTKLLAAINTLDAGGGTDYDKGLLLPLAGGLEISKRGKYNKVIIFLTDGLCSSAQVAKIINEANKQGCQIFTVTVGLACPQLLKDIALGTGGQWFEKIKTDEAITQVYNQILKNAQGANPCEIVWQSAVSCETPTESALFRWQGIDYTQTYTKPARAVAQLKIVPNAIYLRSKPIGVRFDTTITVTAINADFTIADILSSSPLYDISPKSFSLSSGQTRTLAISYTPTDSSYSWTQFDLVSNVCPRSIGVSGSYPGGKRPAPTVKLLSPNGGEVFVGGDDTTITWQGVPATDLVKLEYSSNGGATWEFISDRAQQLKSLWDVPQIASDKCLVRVAHRSIDGWAKSLGSPQDDYGRSIALDDQGNIYITGSFGGTLDFGGITLTSTAYANAFIAKYYPDGGLEWAKQIQGGTSYGYGIQVDAKGTIYLAGNLYDTADFGGIIVPAAKRIGFIATFLNDGSPVFVKQVGAVDQWSLTSVTDLKIDENGNFYITGGFTGWSDFGNGKILATPDMNDDIFVAKYDATGTIVWADHIRCDSNGWENVSTGIEVDDDHNVYVTGYLRHKSYIGSTTIISNGGTDIFLAKYLPDGKVEWARQIGSTGADVGNDLHVAIDGSIYLVGTFVNTADFGGLTLAPDNGVNFFLAKYRPDNTLVWARNAKATLGQRVTSDGTHVYVSGRLQDSTDFGGIVLGKAVNERGLFVAKYRVDGNIEWANSFSSNNWPDATALTVDKYANVHLLGNNYGQIYIANSLLPFFGRYDGFLCKFSEINELQSDVSDAQFTIVKAEPSSQDIDMGSVFVGMMKDSVIKTFIHNTGQYRFKVESISIAGNNANDFQLVSGVPPFIVPAQSSYPVEFRFKPTGTGGRAATIRIRTQAGQFEQAIMGIGVQQTIATISTLINFGAIPVMTSKDTTMKFAVRNVGTVPVNFTDVVQLGPDKTQFILLSGGGAFTLQPGEWREVGVRFAPTSGGRTSGRIGFTYNGQGSPAILNLFGEGIELRKEVSVAPDTIDFGQVLQNDTKDTTLRFVLRNTGNIDVAFSADVQLGPDLTQFTLVSGGGAFILKPNETRDVSLRFAPTAVGKTSGRIGFVHDGVASPATIFLLGEGLRPPKAVTVFRDTIDFGPVEIRKWKDTTITIGFTNSGIVPLVFDKEVHLGPDMTQFQLLSGGGQFTLQPNESREVAIRFVPYSIGHTSGSIGFTYDGSQSPVILYFIGQGVGGVVKIADDSAYAGDTRQIIMHLQKVSASTVQAFASSFRARIAYNASALFPLVGDIIPGNGTDTVTVNGVLNTDNSLTSVPFLTALGNAEVSSMDLVEFVWLDAQGQPANYDVETESGTFKVLGVCEEGGKRLFNPEGQVTITRISPNPASESVQVEIETIEAGRTQVVVMDVLGRTIATLYDGEIASGSHKLNLNTSQIAAGSYYVSLVTPTVKKFARVDIAR